MLGVAVLGQRIKREAEITKGLLLIPRLRQRLRPQRLKRRMIMRLVSVGP
jgi:hypothetical protein